jgi:hypothetical protein
METRKEICIGNFLFPKLSKSQRLNLDCMFVFINKINSLSEMRDKSSFMLNTIAKNLFKKLAIKI